MPSKFDLIWTAVQKDAAAADGWELGIVVDSGQPIRTARCEVFDKGPRFEDRRMALKHVVEYARRGNKLCIAALATCRVFNTEMKK